MGGAEPGEGAWVQERAELLAQLAAESARAAECERQLRDREALRPEPVTVRDAGARLLAREAERHQAEIARVRDNERAALERVEVLGRQLRELRAELHAVQSAHATERMQAELELARAKAEAAGLQALARRRAELQRPTDEELAARVARRAADEALLAAAGGGDAGAAAEDAAADGAARETAAPGITAPEGVTPDDAAPDDAAPDDPDGEPSGEAVIVPPEWVSPSAEVEADPDARSRRGSFWRR